MSCGFEDSNITFCRTHNERRADACRQGLIGLLAMLCDPENQPHQWVGADDELLMQLNTPRPPDPPELECAGCGGTINEDYGQCRRCA